jgi:hypothetical protein
MAAHVDRGPPAPPGRRWYREPAILSAVIGASAVVLAAVISGTFGILIPRSPPPQPPATEPIPTSPITFETFVATATNPDLTDLQRRAFLDEQLHRRIEWEGRVRSVMPGERGDDRRRYLLELLPTEDASQVATCWFDGGWSTELLALKPGQKITVAGVLESWDAAGPRVVGCRLKRL